MNTPRYFSTAGECTTKEGVHRRFTLHWGTDSTDISIELHTLYENDGRLDESVTTVLMQREGAQLLCDLLLAVLHNRHELEAQAVRVPPQNEEEE